MKIIVYHTGFGCDSGCCGHVVQDTDSGKAGRVHTDHPYGDDHLEYARKLVREEFGEDHVSDLDWDNCLISDD